MEGREFLYDVAFSFLSATDEPLAHQLADGLRDRFKVYAYFERQRELAGKDGMDELSKVFGVQARIAVILYRKGWGETQWTRVEATAIKNRALELGFDFTVFIPLDEKPVLPPWFPKTRIYVGLERWGIKGACGVIEQRIVDFGGEPQVQSLADVAGMKQREVERERARSDFRHRPAVDWARADFRRSFDLIKSNAATVPDLNLDVRVERENAVEAWLPQGPVLIVGWHSVFTNSLDGAGLGVCVWRLHPMSNEAMYARGDERQEPLSRRHYLPDLGPDGQPAWVDDDGRFWTLEQIVEESMKDLIRAMPGGREARGQGAS